MGDVAGNLVAIRDRIGAAAERCGRASQDVTLVAVSKTHSTDKILEALAAGQRVFGENRVQEAKSKYPALRTDWPDLELHLIGPLQTNKANDAVALFDVIQTLDREKLARHLAKEMAKQNRQPACFVQVNTGEEPQKAGVLPEEAEAFVSLCRDTLALPVRGLMCIPPVDEESALHFAMLRQIAERCGLSQLSMGMSADFETAIELGATHVRIGSAIFGPRPAQLPN